jgi:hypothetical protein
VKRFAQDDGFAGVLTKNIPIRLTLMGRSPGLSSAVPTGLNSLSPGSHTRSKALMSSSRALRSPAKPKNLLMGGTYFASVTGMVKVWTLAGDVAVMSAL